MKLTAAQGQAVAARGNVLVVAGAGTGKTHALVERCLNCLLEEKPSVSLDQILMVTFTEAAAAEMRQRIRVRLEEESARHPEEIRWHEQLAIFDTAHIGTLHSFCLQLVRPHFYELEIDPQVSVLAEEEARLLAEETLTSVLESHYAGRTPADETVQQLIQTQGAGSDQAIRALVLRLHHYTQTLPDPAQWYEQQTGLFAGEQPTRWEQWLVGAFEEWRAQSLPALEGSAGNAIAERCAAALNAAPPNPPRAVIATALVEISAAFDNCPRGKKTAWLDGLKEFRADSGFLLSLASVGAGTDPLAEDWTWVRGQMTTLLQLAREFGERFSENKRELGMLDFHDLEQCALRLLWDSRANQPTSVAQQWRQKLRFVFVDEYQDINAAQDRIIEALSRTGSRANRFLVGDVKQSIYRFRRADPSIFQRYASHWRDGASHVIPLVENFRSREGILDFINSVFELLMQPGRGGVAYDETARLRFGHPSERSALSAAVEPGPRVELHLRVKGRATEAQLDDAAEAELGDLLELEEAAKEARSVGLRLRELKAQQHSIWDEKSKQSRPVEWGDMAILLRSPAHKTESYAKEFSRLNLPLLVQRGGFYESIEISDLVSLLQVLDNPLQDLPVLAVMHSPLAGLTVNELAAIRLAAKGPFWTALVFWADGRGRRERNEPKEDRIGAVHAEPDPADPATIKRPGRIPEAETRRKVTTFLDRFARWRRLARQSSLSRCLEAVLAETLYDTWLLTQPRGEQRHANVQRFLRLARQFDTFQRQGLFRFLCFIEAQKRADTEPEVRPVSAENAVRLMSIHQSKGLEFPLVVVADLGKAFNLADLRAGIILDEQYGLCPQIKPPHTGKRYPSLPYWLARRRQHRELLGEELRLLYVAMTRARDTLLLSGSVSEKKLHTLWHGGAGSQNLSAARSFCDWLGTWFSANCAAGEALQASGRGLPALSVSASQVEEKSLQQEPAAPLPPSGENRLLRWVIHDDTRLLDSSAEAAEGPAKSETDASPGVWQQLRTRLAWEYSFAAATRAPAKASVTGLLRQALPQSDDDMFRVQSHEEQAGGPLRLSGRSPTRKAAPPDRTSSPAEIGIAHHLFLKLISLERTDSIESLRQEAERLQREQTISPEQIAWLDLGAIAAFWRSELGQSIRLRAKFVKRELPFTARFSPQSLTALTGGLAGARLENEFVVVQGVADLVVQTPDELWLIDFKTDVIRRGEISTKAEIYAPQMRLYAQALSKIYQRAVSGCWLYFLDCQSAVKLTTDH